MAQQFIYQMQGLKKFTPDGKEVLRGIWLSFFPGAKIGVVGPNGAGKSTLLRIMAGLDTEFQGETWIDPKAKIGYLPQEPRLDESLDVRGNIELGLKEVRDLMIEFDAVSAGFAEPDADFDALIARQAELQDQIDAVDGWNLDRTIEVAMDALRVPPGDSDVSTLSGGEKRRVALCQLLLSKPDLMLLDEPTNHLDAETVAWLERALREYPGTVILVTHDRYFLDNVTKWILELEQGKGLPFEGNYSSWLEQKHTKMAQSEKKASARQKILAQELAWVSMNQKARQAKSKARISRYSDMLQEANSQSERAASNEIVIPIGDRLGDLVIELDGVSKAYGDKLLFDELTFRLPAGGIVGVVGANGAGKTTLFKLLTDIEQPDSGTVKIGETVKMVGVEQMRDALDPEKSVWENVSDGLEHIEVGSERLNSRAYVGAFGFKGRSQQQKVGTMSGGERNRVYLAKMLQEGGNVLLLDEPSNDLDVATLRSLEEALLDFPGCAVIISHDRWFLDRIATHILAFEGDSHVEWFEGNYQEYERNKKERLGEAADQPSRIKYKPISR